MWGRWDPHPQWHLQPPPHRAERTPTPLSGADGTPAPYGSYSPPHGADRTPDPYGTYTPPPMDQTGPPHPSYGSYSPLPMGQMRPPPPMAPTAPSPWGR